MWISEGIHARERLEGSDPKFVYSQRLNIYMEETFNAIVV